ncbi:MAG: sulfurtransferase [Peptococcaceae bacterium]|nr:sulfurtransferase [Peptococcaceae bacterium]
MTKTWVIDPIISVDWLKNNLYLDNLVIVDVRGAKDYAAGHIENSINVPFERERGWAVTRDGLTLEVPDLADLVNIIESCGISNDSVVVIVSAIPEASNPPYPLADAARTADTLLYAGLKNVAILDGGYPKWVAEGMEVTTFVPRTKKGSFQPNPNNNIFVKREYVEKHIGKVTIIDARDADVYFGITIEEFAPKAGHIPSARSLPAPWIWNEDGTFKDKQVLENMALGVIGYDKNQEIIIYCGVGGFTSAWWYVLTQLLGYENVKFYDGSAQDWVKNNFMVTYSWTL